MNEFEELLKKARGRKEQQQLHDLGVITEEVIHFNGTKKVSVRQLEMNKQAAADVLMSIKIMLNFSESESE